MKISLHRTNITKVSFEVAQERVPNDQDKNGGHFEINFDKIYPQGNTKEFIIKFNLKINDLEENFSLDMSSNAFFTTDEDIDDEFKNSQFPNINAPAIAFPFLRAHVANFTLNAGLNPIMLPTINFTAFNKEPKTETNNIIK